MLTIWNTPERFLPLLFVYAIGGLIVAEIRRWAEAPAWTLTCYWGVYFFDDVERRRTRNFNSPISPEPSRFSFSGSSGGP